MQRELRRLLHVPAPVGLGVVLRVRVLDRHAAGGDRRGGRETEFIAALERAERAARPRRTLRVELHADGAPALLAVGPRTPPVPPPGTGDRGRAAPPARPRNP